MNINIWLILRNWTSFAISKFAIIEEIPSKLLRYIIFAVDDSLKHQNQIKVTIQTLDT